MRLSSSTLLLAITGLLGVASCRPEVAVPKPRGYYKIDLPAEHTYQKFDDAKFPYSFEYPTYAQITQDTNLIKEENEPYWINVKFPDLNATIYLSYKQIKAGQNISQLINESYNLSYKHEVRADFIDAPEFVTGNGLSGVFYTVGGNAASLYQFYATDSVKNFMRGSLYFEVTPNTDSLKPAAEYLKVDLEHIVQSLKFK